MLSKRKILSFLFLSTSLNCLGFTAHGTEKEKMELKTEKVQQLAYNDKKVILDEYLEVRTKSPDDFNKWVDKVYRKSNGFQLLTDISDRVYHRQLSRYIDEKNSLYYNELYLDALLSGNLKPQSICGDTENTYLDWQPWRTWSHDTNKIFMDQYREMIYKPQADFKVWVDKTYSKPGDTLHGPIGVKLLKEQRQHELKKDPNDLHVHKWVSCLATEEEKENNKYLSWIANESEGPLSETKEEKEERLKRVQEKRSNFFKG